MRAIAVVPGTTNVRLVERPDFAGVLRHHGADESEAVVERAR